MMRVAMTMFGAAALIGSAGSWAKAPASATASAETQTEARARAAQAQIDIVAKRLCKAEPVVGTRLAVQRRCATPAELVEYRRQAQEMIQTFRQMPCIAGTTAGEPPVTLSC